jgi:predicted transposase/invertase (TIGR01784 family)
MRFFRRLFEAANIAKFSTTERTEYEDSLKVYRDLKNSIDTAVEQGREEGRAQGLVEGRAEGLVEGQVQQARKIARNLLEAGLDPEKISQMTDLSITEIRELEDS